MKNLMDEKAEPSVWYVAGLAVCILVAVMFVGGMFTGAEATAITTK